MGSLRDAFGSKNEDVYEEEVQNFIKSLDEVIARYTSRPPYKKELAALEFEFKRVMRYLSSRPYKVRKGCHDAIMLRELSLNRIGFIVENNLLGIQTERRSQATPLWIDDRFEKRRGIGMQYTINGKPVK
jgi:hypothetical protein